MVCFKLPHGRACDIWVVAREFPVKVCIPDSRGHLSNKRQQLLWTLG